MAIPLKQDELPAIGPILATSDSVETMRLSISGVPSAPGYESVWHSLGRCHRLTRLSVGLASFTEKVAFFNAVRAMENLRFLRLIGVPTDPVHVILHVKDVLEFTQASKISSLDLCGLQQPPFDLEQQDIGRIRSESLTHLCGKFRRGGCLAPGLVFLTVTMTKSRKFSLDKCGSE